MQIFYRFFIFFEKGGKDNYNYKSSFQSGKGFGGQFISF